LPFGEIPDALKYVRPFSKFILNSILNFIIQTLLLYQMELEFALKKHLELLHCK